MKFILGRKTGMTRVFDDEGRNFAVTEVVPYRCKISKINRKDREGYNSVQVTAYKKEDEKKIKKITEFKEQNIKKFKVGDLVSADQFTKNEVVTVEGTAKGKGFAGTIKRHGFSRGPASHGSKNVRKPGSIGGGYPQRVLPGKKMAGRMGGSNVTIKNLKIFDINNDLLLITGAIPGAKNSIVKIYGKGEKAEEIIDTAAEEEKRAQERMLEAEKEAKEKKPEGGTDTPDYKDEQKGINIEENKPEEKVEEKPEQ